MFLLVVLVFAAGLILDTGAVLELVGGLLWAHALVAAVAIVLAVAAGVLWGRLRGRKARRPRGRAGGARRAAAPQQKRAEGAARPRRGGKTTRAR